MIRLILFALVACGGAKRIEPVVTVGSGAPVTPPAVAAVEVVTEAEPPDEDPPDHPWGGDPLARLPKIDFVAPYAKSSDVAKTKQASALHAEGIARQAAKDWRGAEQKYTAALAIDPGHVDARYALASIEVQLGAADRALALLFELRHANCRDCVVAVGRAQWDDDWVSLWDRLAFSRLGHRAHDETWVATATCAAGLEPQKTWEEGEFSCLRNGQLHGKFGRTGFGADWSGHGNSEEFGEYRDGKKHGLWTLHHSNGATGFYTLEYGAYVDDAKHGLWVSSEHGRGGGKEVLEKWVRGKREGVTRTRNQVAHLEPDDSDFTVVEGMLEEDTYAGDVLDGPTKRWLAGRVVRDGAYRKGKQHGRWVEYEQGKPVAETEFLDGEKHGTWVLRTVAGDKKYSGTWDRGRAVGDHEYWHAGKLVGKTTIRNFSGAWIAYVDGKLVEKGRLVDGKRDGRWTFKEYNTWHEGTYARGRRTGKWVLSDFITRNREEEGPYVDDHQQGAWTFWRERTLRAKGRFADGLVDGSWTIFDDTGAAAQALKFRAGDLIEVDGEPPTEVQLANYAAGSFLSSPNKIESEPSFFPPM